MQQIRLNQAVNCGAKINDKPNDECNKVKCRHQ